MYHGVLAVTSSRHLSSAHAHTPHRTLTLAASTYSSPGRTPPTARLGKPASASTTGQHPPNLLPTLVLAFLVFAGINMYLHMRSLTGFSTSCLCPFY
ncbi:hypothetical protein ElyMa_004808000 [Elysia marginata]|uniref:Uncharacterized protein n=1 Tax=Elysia marginata TaxID=1093978 RepID=A0AAV4IJI0_9GAST|nr:hypothetical protein ElyMa_004808000 [Elysia marginata]